MKELRLDEFLDSARAEGVTDSEGVFTISHVQAMQKMARYSLPYPEAWILKIIQSAVIWEAGEIVIEQSRLYTTIEFCPSEKKNIPTEQDVVATLIGDSAASAVPVGKLCLGLRSLVRLEDYSFILTLNTGRNEVRPLYAGRDAQALTQLHRLRLSRRKSPGIKIVVIHLREGENVVGRLIYPFVPWLRRDRQIASEIGRSAGACSVPIVLNGRPLTNLLETINYGFNSKTRPLHLSGVSLTGQSLLNLGAGTRETHLPYYSRNVELEQAEGTRSDFSAWYLCQVKRKAVLPERSPGLEQTTHEIHWICDGVVVQCDTFLLPTHLVKLVIFLNADGLQTDITGMLLKETDEKTERWECHLDLIKKEFSRLSTETKQFFPEQPPKKRRVESPTVEHYLKRDFTTLSELENPSLERRTRPAARRRFSRRFDQGLTRTDSGKYVSEVVKSRDGNSHLIIRSNSSP